MKETKIKVCTSLNNIEENNEFLAVINEFLIKYIDLENNKMTIDMKNNIIIRENRDYLFTMDFNYSKISILMKKLNKEFVKDIKTIVISRTSSKYLVRYLLVDENIINEYYVKFLK